mmetsp:Transcript_9653/g.28681  ORF Transcript_9653/g.28681 Transcript_9653/m.28681 type:complete len:207 (+) Transcript_9653:488-1108(+)
MAIPELLRPLLSPTPSFISLMLVRLPDRKAPHPNVPHPADELVLVFEFFARVAKLFVQAAVGGRKSDGHRRATRTFPDAFDNGQISDSGITDNAIVMLLHACVFGVALVGKQRGATRGRTGLCGARGAEVQHGLTPDGCREQRPACRSQRGRLDTLANPLKILLDFQIRLPPASSAKCFVVIIMRESHGAASCGDVAQYLADPAPG